MSTPHILISNDDGIFARGIRALAQGLKEIATVDVVAPNAQQSAVGHALTVSEPLRVEKYEHGSEFFGWAVNGTPADSVKIAIDNLLPNKPDLVVSGINHGRNTATSIMYSGTVSAATEGTILGIPSIAISYDDLSLDAHFDVAVEAAKRIVEIVLEKKLPPGVLLNVNVPALPSEQIQGFKIAPQGRSYWNDHYELRLDPIGREYYWLSGDYVLVGEESDDHALNAGFVTVTPIHYRLTDEAMLQRMQDWNLEEVALPTLMR